MGRPTKRERRNRQLNLKLTERELGWVHKRATARGLKPVEFGRAQLFAERRTRRKSTETPPHLDPLFIAQLSRIGNNLNQMTRRFHEFRVPPPDSLGPLLGLIRDLIGKAARDGS